MLDPGIFGTLVPEGWFRLVPGFFGLLAIAPLSNALANRIPGCLRNSAFFLMLTISIPALLLGLGTVALVYRRGFSRLSAGPGKIGDRPGRIEFSLMKTCEADAFDAFPKTVIKIDVEKALAILKVCGYSEVSDAGVMCVVEKDGIESTVFSGGRILVKSPDEDVAGRVAAAIYETIAGALS